MGALTCQQQGSAKQSKARSCNPSRSSSPSSPSLAPPPSSQRTSSRSPPPPSLMRKDSSTPTSRRSSKSTKTPSSCQPPSSRPSPRTVRTSTTTWSSGASSRRQLPPSPTASPVSVAASPTLLVRHGAPSREALAPSDQPPRRPERGRTLSSRKQPPHSAARASPTSLGVPSMSSSRRPSKCALSSACVSHRTSLSVVGPTQHPSQWLLPSALAVGSLASLQLTT